MTINLDGLKDFIAANAGEIANADDLEVIKEAAARINTAVASAAKAHVVHKANARKSDEIATLKARLEVLEGPKE
jgi:NAD/NADP transhydrogenase alpha subunit